MQQPLATVDAVFDALGGATRITEITGSKLNAVVEWRRGGRIPAKMFLVMSAALRERGHSVDPAVFGMATPADAAAE